MRGGRLLKPAKTDHVGTEVEDSTNDLGWTLFERVNAMAPHQLVDQLIVTQLYIVCYTVHEFSGESFTQS